MPDTSTRERGARIDANEPKVLPPCPPWCRWSVLLPGPPHTYDSVLPDDDQTYTRQHIDRISDDSEFEIFQAEYNRHGVVTLGPVLIATAATAR
jgi:hypothetical protein